MVPLLGQYQEPEMKGIQINFMQIQEEDQSSLDSADIQEDTVEATNPDERGITHPPVKSSSEQLKRSLDVKP
jgi:hypothetical protein